MAHNSARVGGAVHATEIKMYVYGETIIANNTATQHGGGFIFIKVY